MKVLITSPKGKEKLVAEFARYAEVVTEMASDVSLIIPTVDEELPFFASANQWFFDQGVVVMVGDENTIFHSRDKMQFHQWCNRHGFQTPRTWQLDGHLKPRFGKGSRGIIRVQHNYILQEHCSFPEVSVDYFADWDGTPVSVIPRYRLDVVDGESQSMKLVENIDLSEIKRLGMELGLIGHNVIQGYYTGEVFIFGEVNPRFGGGSHLTWNIFNGPKWLIENMGNDNVSERKSASLRSGLPRKI